MKWRSVWRKLERMVEESAATYLRESLPKFLERRDEIYIRIKCALAEN
jgi:hypothetical protein